MDVFMLQLEKKQDKRKTVQRQLQSLFLRLQNLYIKYCLQQSLCCVNLIKAFSKKHLISVV